MWEWDTNIIAAFVSAGVSFFLTFIYWCGKGIYKWWKKRKHFETYKGYVKEILENLIHYHDTQKIRCTIDPQKPKDYSLDDLKFLYIIKEGNKEKSINQDFIVSVFLSFIQKRDLLDDKEMKLLTGILGNMSTEQWCSKAKYVDNSKENKNKQIDFTGVIIRCKDIRISHLLSDYYSMLHEENKHFYEKLLGQLKHKEFDERINRIIDKNINDLTSDS